jgi:integrase
VCHKLRKLPNVPGVSLQKPRPKGLPEVRGLPPIRWHDLRHTCATLLPGRGVHPKLVQHLLGHASITMTLDRYSQWIRSMGRHAADSMDEALN